MKKYYTTDGPVRGNCGHKHRELRTALACLANDQAGCAAQGGYSDRQVIYTDDAQARLQDGEDSQGPCHNPAA